MPGLSLEYSLREHPVAESPMLSALGSMLWEKDYRRDVLLRVPRLLVACTRYSEYPVVCFEEEGIWGCLEGRIYGKTAEELQRELVLTARRMLAPNVPAAALRDWLLGADGEFVIIAHDSAAGAVAVLNDSLGQLPLVYGESGGYLTVSRHLSIAARSRGAARFDRMALAQYLLFRHTLGDRTLIEGVRRLPPGSLLRAGVGAGGVECLRLHTYDFSRTNGNSLDAEANAQELARLLCQASARRRSPIGRHGVLLSGGIDSRVVSAALARSGPPVPAATYEEPGIADVAGAGSIARTLGIDLTVVRVYPAKGRDALALLRAKDGEVGMRVAFHMPFARRVAQMWGRDAIAFTGAGGGIVTPDVRPARSILDAGEFLRHVLGRNAMMSLADAAEFVGVSERDICDDILAWAAAFPETDWVERYVHLLLYGRVLIWTVQIFDSHRSYLWTTSPFLATDVFRHVMSVPPEQKSFERLRCRVLELLSPELARIADSNYGLRPGTVVHKAALCLAGILKHHPRLWKQLKRVFLPQFHRRAYGPTTGLVRCLRDQARECGAVTEWLSPAAIERMASEAPARHLWELESLFSATSAIEWLATGRSRNEAYCDDNITV